MKRKIKNVKARRKIKRKRPQKKFSKLQDKRWLEHKQFIENRIEEEWIVNAKRALDWFLSIMGQEQWSKRKKAIVAYFRKQQEGLLPEQGKKRPNLSDDEKIIAFHSDWIAWYLYLVESLYFRPYVGEPSQSARVFPFFSTIGRDIEIAKNIKGIENKLNELLKGKDNQPDATLFEICVAILYARNGWNVEFVPETAEKKTPDLLVFKENKRFYVECKRLGKVTEYSEKERKEWLKRWDKLVPVMAAYKIPTFLDVTFKVEVSDTPETILATAFSEIVREKKIDSGCSLENDQISVTVNHIDMDAVNKHFYDYQVKWNSPQMVALFAGGYESSGNYTQVHSPIGINAVGPDDDEHILNLFCTGVHNAYCAKWECVAENSIDKKAKDVRKLLSKAVKQAPENKPTIVHIAYETLHGPFVEFHRHRKITKSIDEFDYQKKEIKAVFCHALQPSVGIEDSEWAETTIRYGRLDTIPSEILPHNLLLEESGTQIVGDTHWNQDLNSTLEIEEKNDDFK